MSLADKAETVQRAASNVMYGGSAVSAGSGVTAGVARYMGMTPDEWMLFFSAIGAFVAVAGYFTSLYFKAQHLKLARETAHADPEA